MTDTALLKPADLKRLYHLIQRAQKGDHAALDDLRPYVDQIPDLWARYQTIIRAPIHLLLDAFKTSDDVNVVALEHHLARLSQELAGPTPTPLERLVVERIAACWLYLTYLESHYYAQRETLAPPQNEDFQRRINHAQNRYLQAVKTLAQLRRLLLPTVQVNIAAPGGQQINIAGDLNTAPPTPP